MMLKILETAISSLNNLDNLAMRIAASKLGVVAIATLSLLLGVINQLPSAQAGVDLYYSGLIAPSTGGMQSSTTCPTDGIAVGVTLPQIGQVNNILTHFGLKCHATEMPTSSNSRFDDSIFVSMTPGKLSPQTIFCPTGSAIVGFSAYTAGYVVDVAPVCGDVTKGNLTSVPMVGAVASSSLNAKTICPQIDGKQTFVVGLSGKVGAGVDSFRAICALFTSAATQPTLLAKFLPRGNLNSNSTIPATETRPGYQITTLRQAANDGGINTDVFPFRTSTYFDPTHYLEFAIFPDAGKTIRISKLTYSSRSYSALSTLPNAEMGLSASILEIRSIPRTNPSDGNFQSTLSTFNLKSGRVGQEILLDNSSSLYFPPITKPTTFRIYFHGGTGYQWNDLSGHAGSGGTGMQIFGTVENFNPEEKLVLDQPINITYITKLGTVQCSADIPASLQSRENLQGILSSPLLGYPVQQPLLGKVANGKVTFVVPYSTQVMGNHIPLEIRLKSGAIESPSISTFVLIPKTSSFSGKATPRATSKATPKPSKSAPVTSAPTSSTTK
jgi:hypothetical protein